MMVNKLLLVIFLWEKLIEALVEAKLQNCHLFAMQVSVHTELL